MFYYVNIACYQAPRGKEAGVWRAHGLVSPG